MKVIRGRLKECPCGSFLCYDDNDIEIVERSYNVGTYNGETYMAKIITCPICLRKLEVS